MIDRTEIMRLADAYAFATAAFAFAKSIESRAQPGVVETLREAAHQARLDLVVALGVEDDPIVGREATFINPLRL